MVVVVVLCKSIIVGPDQGNNTISQMSLLVWSKKKKGKKKGKSAAGVHPAQRGLRRRRQRAEPRTVQPGRGGLTCPILGTHTHTHTQTHTRVVFVKEDYLLTMRPQRMGFHAERLNVNHSEGKVERATCVRVCVCARARACLSV